MHVNIETREQFGTGLFFIIIESESGRPIRITKEEKLFSGEIIGLMPFEDILNEKEEVIKKLKTMKHYVSDKGFKYCAVEDLVKYIKGYQDRKYHCYEYMVANLNKFDKETKELFYHEPKISDGKDFLMKQYRTMISLSPRYNKSI